MSQTALPCPLAGHCEKHNFCLLKHPCLTVESKALRWTVLPFARRIPLLLNTSHDWNTLKQYLCVQPAAEFKTSDFFTPAHAAQQLQCGQHLCNPVPAVCQEPNWQSSHGQCQGLTLTVLPRIDNAKTAVCRSCSLLAQDSADIYSKQEAACRCMVVNEGGRVEGGRGCTDRWVAGS